MKLINNYMKHPPYRGGNSLGLRDILDMLITHFTIVLISFPLHFFTAGCGLAFCRLKYF